MKFESKFNFMDKVWHIWRNHETKWVACSFCEGVGRITGADQQKRLCPECYGKSGKYEYLPLKWMVQGILTIGRINIEAITDQGGDPESIFDNYKPQEASYEESYMCFETGIGSGTIHYSNILFATKEEAQAECDKLNAVEEMPEVEDA